MRQLKIAQQITSRETISVSKYLQEVSTIPLLTMDEELALPSKIKEGDARALKRFVEGNLRFVVSVAKQYQGSGEKLDDLISAGNEGLIEAAKRFDTTRGFKFISYAVWWIRQSIQKHIAENSKQIRLPLNKISLVNKIKTVTSQLEQSLQRNPSVEEIREEIELKFEKVKIEPGDIERIMASNTPLSSLDMTLGENSESTLADLLITETLGDVAQTLKQQDLKLTLQKVFNKKFSPREKDVISMSFGIFGEKQHTLDEIGYKFDLTRERVRQIKEKALRKLKFNSTAAELKEYM
jgi:RNA polymerase primary sigma factor